MQWVTGNCEHCGNETKTMLEYVDEFFVCSDCLDEYY